MAFLHVVMPPDTSPSARKRLTVKGSQTKAWTDGGIYLHVLGALSAGLEGKQPANLAGLKQGGAIGVSNTAAGFESDLVLLRCLEYAATFDIKVFFYPDEPSLSAGVWLMMAISHLFHGLQGIPWLAETIALSKQILMTEETGIHAHFSQITCRTSVELIRHAKQKGLPITCDVAMHQLHPDR